MGAPPAKRGGTAIGHVRPAWVLSAVRFVGKCVPAWSDSMTDEANGAAQAAHRRRVAEAASRVRRAWPELWRRVFRPLGEKASDLRSPDVVAAGHRCSADLVGWLVTEAALLWFAGLSTNPIKRHRELKRQLLAADHTVLEAGRSFLLALRSYEATRQEAQQAHIDCGKGCWDDDLTSALESVASWSPTWASLVGHDDGALREVLRTTAETSQPTPGVKDVMRAAMDNLRFSGVWAPAETKHGGSKPDGEETLAVPFMESLERIKRKVGCVESGPLDWLGPDRLTFLLQTVRGNARHPSRDTVRNARKTVLDRRGMTTGRSST